MEYQPLFVLNGEHVHLFYNLYRVCFSFYRTTGIGLTVDTFSSSFPCCSTQQDSVTVNCGGQHLFAEGNTTRLCHQGT